MNQPGYNNETASGGTGSASATSNARTQTGVIPFSQRTAEEITAGWDEWKAKRYYKMAWPADWSNQTFSRREPKPPTFGDIDRWQLISSDEEGLIFSPYHMPQEVLSGQVTLQKYVMDWLARRETLARGSGSLPVSSRNPRRTSDSVEDAVTRFLRQRELGEK